METLECNCYTCNKALTKSEIRPTYIEHIDEFVPMCKQCFLKEFRRMLDED